MKKFFQIFLGLSVFFFLSFVTFHANELYKLKRQMKFKIPKQVDAQKPIVVIIPSYNNSKYYEWNLRSIFNQKYDNFRVIYINDASTDDTYEKVQSFVQKSPHHIKVTLINNPTNQGTLATLYNAIHTCSDDEIIIPVEGSDALAHDGVLDTINRVYSSGDVWMTYGNYLDYPSYAQSPKICQEIALRVLYRNAHRSAPWVTSHLRTYYAGLFKKIKLQDFLYKGNFLPQETDRCIMIPLLEMSGPHVHFIKETLYLYNRQTPCNDQKVNLKLEAVYHGHLKTLPSYSRLETLVNKKQSHNKDAELVIFSYDRPLQLWALLESIQLYASNISKLSVIYKTSSEAFEKGYTKVKDKFPQAHFLKEDNNDAQSFRSLFLKTAFSEAPDSASYILFSVDDILLTGHIDVASCVQKMQQTKAYGFFISLGKNIRYSYTHKTPLPLPPHVALGPQAYAWQFGLGEYEWDYPHSLDLVLYRKADIKKTLEKLSFNNPPTLESNWAQKSRKKRMGICFETSRCVNIPMNLASPSTKSHNTTYSTNELLNLFNQNKKMNIKPLHYNVSSSRHIDYIPSFIER
jgi:glycosyltransferase involved in cell wall biosynthesis